MGSSSCFNPTAYVDSGSVEKQVVAWSGLVKQSSCGTRWRAPRMYVNSARSPIKASGGLV